MKVYKKKLMIVIMSLFFVFFSYCSYQHELKVSVDNITIDNKTWCVGEEVQWNDEVVTIKHIHYDKFKKECYVFYTSKDNNYWITHGNRVNKMFIKINNTTV